MKRIFLIVLDSFGIGEQPDAAKYQDEGSNTIAAAASSSFFHLPNLAKMGLFHIDGVTCREVAEVPCGAFARMTERSNGKDTTIGHWEIAGIVSEDPLPTYPEGFPTEILEPFERETGRKVICNKPYSGTAVLDDYGKEQVETGALIVYTSADSVFQIAAHEGVVPVADLYRYCELARKMLVGKHGVGRVIARPFVGTFPSYQRTTNRHDFSLLPPSTTMLDQLLVAKKEVIAVGKINDIFAGKGIGEFTRTASNAEGIEQTIALMKRDFEGLCFVNLVDFDMLYGHRNDADGYAKALTAFDEKLPEILAGLREDDLLMITADHGCDPLTPSTDHSREYTPLLIYGKHISPKNLGTRASFADIAATILDYYQINSQVAGDSLLPEIWLRENAHEK